MKLKYHTLDKNGNPRPEAISHLIEFFGLIPDNSRINLCYGKVENFDDCGGLQSWLVFVMNKNGIEIKSDYNIDEPSDSYLAQIAMSKILGFDKPWLLREWAMCNPPLWGNFFAGDMFVCSMAYGKESLEVINIKDIKVHWKGVAKRIKELNKET